MHPSRHPSLLGFTAALAGLVPALGAAEGVVASLPITLYGYAKVDAVYETRETQGVQPRWVANTDDDDGRFFMSARQTRLGLKIDGPDAPGLDIGGTIEIDFYGDGNDDQVSARPRLRHAYAEVTWEEQDLTLLAGQTWDLVSPELATAVHFAALWWAGDIGFRRSQIRLSKAIEGDSIDLDLAAAITGNTGDMDVQTPGAQLRVELGFPLMERTATVTLSGASGEADDGAQSYVVNLGYQVPLGEQFTVSGTVWTGQNLQKFLGGVGQNGPDGAEVAATGGWLQIGMKPSESPWSFNVGIGLDDPDDDDLAAGARASNLSAFLNAFYKPYPGLTLGAELQHLETDYVDGESRDSLRTQFAVIYAF